MHGPCCKAPLRLYCTDHIHKSHPEPLLCCRFSDLATPSRDVEKKVVLRIESGDDSVLGSRWGHAVHISAGWDPFELVDRAVAAAAFLSGGAKPRVEKTLPPSLDVFGWCTWDAFYSKISGRGKLNQAITQM